MIRKIFEWIGKHFKPKKRQDFSVMPKNLGLLKDKKDSRDYKATAGFIGDMPKSFSLKKYVVELKNQSTRGSCVPHAVCSCYELMRNMQKDVRIKTSELYLYYHGRKLGNLYPQDKGTYPRDVLKVAQKTGIAYELFHPYSLPLNQEPDWKSDWSAKFTRIKSYARVYDIKSMKNLLIQGRPTMISLQIYSRLYNVSKEGILKKEKGVVRGAHELFIVGYDNERKAFEVLNSWGISFGNRGFFWLPYDVLQKQGLDKGFSSYVMQI